MLNNRRRALISAAQTGEEPSGSHNLPSAYQEVEYLQNTGTQQITTDVDVSPTIRLVCKEAFVSSERQSDDGWCDIGKNRFFWGATTTPSYRVAVNHTDAAVVLPVSFDTNPHIFDLQSGNQAFDGVTYATTALETHTASYRPTIYLFGRNATWGVDSRGGIRRIYYCEIYDNNVLVCNLIPCYRKSDNFAGMYDLVNDVFHTNMIGPGTTFIVGPDVI